MGRASRQCRLARPIHPCQRDSVTSFDGQFGKFKRSLFRHCNCTSRLRMEHWSVGPRIRQPEIDLMPAAYLHLRELPPGIVDPAVELTRQSAGATVCPADPSRIDPRPAIVIAQGEVLLRPLAVGLLRFLTPSGSLGGQPFRVSLPTRVLVPQGIILIDSLLHGDRISTRPHHRLAAK